MLTQFVQHLSTDNNSWQPTHHMASSTQNPNLDNTEAYVSKAVTETLRGRVRGWSPHTSLQQYTIFPWHCKVTKKRCHLIVPSLQLMVFQGHIHLMFSACQATIHWKRNEINGCTSNSISFYYFRLSWSHYSAMR